MHSVRVVPLVIEALIARNVDGNPDTAFPPSQFLSLRHPSRRRGVSRAELRLREGAMISDDALVRWLGRALL